MQARIRAALTFSGLSPTVDDMIDDNKVVVSIVDAKDDEKCHQMWDLVMSGEKHETSGAVNNRISVKSESDMKR